MTSSQKVTLTEVISFLFFTFFAMVLAFFASSAVFS
jgi:hypothetical protein